MGNAACCSEDKAALAAQEANTLKDQAVPISDDILPAAKATEGPDVVLDFDDIFTIMLNTAGGSKLGLDVDVAAGSGSLPIRAITGGLAEQWNAAHPDRLLQKGCCIVDVNGAVGDVTAMLENCKNHKELTMKVKRAPSLENLVADLTKLITAKGCGPIMIRLSWHDAGVYLAGKGGCPNAVMRLPESAEAQFAANKGLDVAIGLLKPIQEKYVPNYVSNADLWTLAANVAIKCMAGPEITTRFGRIDGIASESVASAEGRLPDGDKGVDHLRAIFHPKGFDDQAIVALSGAHTVGHCHLQRSGFEGPWTAEPLKFDNTYFTDLVQKQYKPETTPAGNPQHRCPKSGTMMLISDLALLTDTSFKKYVEKYAADQGAFFSDFKQSWIKLQENGCGPLRSAP